MKSNGLEQRKVFIETYGCQMDAPALSERMRVEGLQDDNGMYYRALGKKWIFSIC